MKKYNRFMELFWLSITVAIILVVTFMGIKEGFDTWYINYVFAAMSAGTFFMRRYMRRRMEKHEAFLQQQNNTGSNQ
jgi:hypothetical protein